MNVFQEWRTKPRSRTPSAETAKVGREVDAKDVIDVVDVSEAHMRDFPMFRASRLSPLEFDEFGAPEGAFGRFKDIRSLLASSGEPDEHVQLAL